jgi:CheY-like chemotaxis protein
MKKRMSLSSQRVPALKPRILIVDDESSFVKLLAEILGERDYICLGCQSGQEALHLSLRSKGLVLCYPPLEFVRKR